MRGSYVEFDTILAYHGIEERLNDRIFRRILWTFDPYIKACRHCISLVQVDRTHLYRKYKGTLLVVLAQDDNQNILPVAFAIVEGETSDAWYFFFFFGVLSM